MQPLPQIIHHGAVDGVTGSCHELVLDEKHSVLVDCGLFQGDEASGRGGDSRHPAIDFSVARVRALVVTHVHIDHVGRIPQLLAAGFRGPIYCSEPSAVLLPMVLADALKIGACDDDGTTARTLRQLARQLVPVPYGAWRALPECGAALARLRLQRAGHILGSAYVEWSIGRGPEERRVVFSGDLGAPGTPLLPAPLPPERADILVLESTYGDRRHEGRQLRMQKLRQIIEHALRDRGAVLIPAFSIGRTQELLYELEDIVHRYRNRPVADGLPWGELEIVVDSPLASRFTSTYRKLKAFWDDEAQQRLSQGRHPLNFLQLRTVRTHADHQKILGHIRRHQYPCVVIAASGMCAGGRMGNYVKALIGSPSTDIVFVGYQARGTPGRAIQKFGPRGGTVQLDGTNYPIRAAVHTISGYSAHAGQDDLLRFVTQMAEPPGRICLIHGDRSAKRALQANLQGLLPATQVMVPARARAQSGPQ